MSYFKRVLIVVASLVFTTIMSFALKAEYRFETCSGDITTVNNQGDKLDGNLTGDAKVVLNDGKIKNGVSFSGNGAMVVEHDADLDLVDNLTITFWVNPDEKKRQALIVRGDGNGTRFGSNAEYSLVLWEDGRFKYKHNMTANTFSNASIPLNSWTHIALVRDNSAKSIKIYINGVLDANNSYTLDPLSSHSEKLLIGTGEHYSNTMNNFDGKLDEIKIYNIALSQDNISDIYNRENNGTHVTGGCQEPPEALNDSADLPFAGTVNIDILANDRGNDSDECRVDASTIVIVSTFADSNLSDNNKTLRVANQGVWSVLDSGILRFVSDSNFLGNPTPISYIVYDSCGNASNSATVSLTRVNDGSANPNQDQDGNDNNGDSNQNQDDDDNNDNGNNNNDNGGVNSNSNQNDNNNNDNIDDDSDDYLYIDNLDNGNSGNGNNGSNNIIDNNNPNTSNQGELYTIGDRVWYDRNGNGVQDSHESGVEGVIVVLYNTSGGVVARTTTNSSGEYLFNNIPAGSYILGFSNLPANYIFTSQDVGSNDRLDSDVNSEGRTSIFTIGNIENDLIYDAGIIQRETPTPSENNMTGDNNNTANSDINCECEPYKSSIASLNGYGLLILSILMSLLALFFRKGEKELNYI